MTDLVDAILAAHGLAAPWTTLEATGVANLIYATADTVLRIATDHPDAACDARTESVAAPAAREAGVRTPRLLVFDDSRALVDRPYSIWERVRGETLGRAGLDPGQRRSTWSAIGREVARLHDKVRVCADPLGYLDTPGYELDLAPTLARAGDAEAVPRSVVREIEHMLQELEPHVSGATVDRCFVHNDLHEMNVMCTAAGDLLALLDWGDAGWGDPTLDFVAAPLDMVPEMFAGYGPRARHRLGAFPEARIIWTRLHDALDDALARPGRPIPLADFRRFLDRA